MEVTSKTRKCQSREGKNGFESFLRSGKVLPAFLKAVTFACCPDCQILRADSLLMKVVIPRAPYRSASRIDFDSDEDTYHRGERASKAQ